jgi:hypothetical protein
MNAPDAVLLLHATCPHCPAVLNTLAELVKQGALGSLEVVNITAKPERAEALGIRSVPWYRIGDFELNGRRSPEELRLWAERARDDSGMAAYFDELLQQQGIATVEHILAQHPRHFSAVLTLLGDPDSAIQTRLGIGAILESYAGTATLRGLLTPLAELTRHSDHRLRTDACHYLGLTHAEQARPYLSACLQDTNAEVRETAADSLALLDGK